MNSITHVIFDLDDLLISTGDHYRTAIAEYLALFGNDYPFELRRKLQGRKFEICAAILVKEYNLPVDPMEIVKYVHGKITPELWRDCNFLPGAADLINYFGSHGVPMAVATGSDVHQLEHKMHRNKDVWAKMHHVIATGGNPEVKHGKPAPDIFLIALNHFNDPLAVPERTLVFEDSWNGVCAGIAAGMRVVWVPTADEGQGFPDDSLSKEAEERVYRINSLKDFNPSVFGLPSMEF